MKLAVNYSPEAADLLNEQKIELDVFKCPDFSEELIKQAQNLRDSYVHFNLNVGRGQMDSVNWDLIHKLRDQTDTPFINVHAVAFTKDYPEIDIFTERAVDVKRIKDAVIEDVHIVAEQVGMENIILENVICRGKGENMLRPIIDPAVLKEIVEQTGCGFLLDTAHVRMTSLSLGYDPYTYISQLPLDSLKELHITGIQTDEKGRLRDSMPMTNEDWELARRVIQQIKDGKIPEPWITALEYGGVGPAFEWRTSESVIKEQVSVLCGLLEDEEGSK